MEKAYLKLDGIMGDTKTGKFAGQLELASFSYGCSQATTPLSGTLRNGELPSNGYPTHSMLEFTKIPGSASTDICKHVWSGIPIAQAQLTACRRNNGEAVPFLVISLQNVIVAEYKLVSSEGLSKEIVSLKFLKISFEYLPEDATTNPQGIVHDLDSNEVSSLG